MHVKTKGRLAVAAMVDLALQGAHGPVALAAIARRQGISISYLEQLFGKLRRHEFVYSIRGPGGGYRLCHRAENISVADIVVAVDEAPDERYAASAQGEGEGAEAANRLVTRSLWAGLDARMGDYLASISLKSLADEQRAAGVRIEKASPKLGILPRIVVRPIRVKGPNSVFALGDLRAKSMTG